MLKHTLVFVGLLALGSCLDSKDYDIDAITITPTMALPLASGDLGLTNLVSDKDSKYVKVYPDGLMYLLYSDTLHSKGIRNLFNPANKNSPHTVNLPAATIPPNPFDFRSDSIVQAIDLNLNPALLTEMGIKTGTLNYSVSTTPSLPNVSIAINIVLTDVVNPVTQVPLSITTSGSGTQSLQNYKTRKGKRNYLL